VTLLGYNSTGHARARLERLTDGSEQWWAGLHYCPAQVMGVGLGATVSEAFQNAQAGYVNAVGISVDARSGKDA
jgi:hypothetical protein